MEQVIKDAQNRINKSIEALRLELAKVRTGKATTDLLDEIKVDYYVTPSPMTQVGSVWVIDPHT